MQGFYNCAKGSYAIYIAWFSKGHRRIKSLDAHILGLHTMGGIHNASKDHKGNTSQEFLIT